MKRITIILAAVALITATSCNGVPKLTSQKDTLSWAMGESIAKGLIETNSQNLDKDVIIAAVEATVKGKKQPLDDDTYKAAVMYIQNQLLMEQQTAAMEQRTSANEAETKAWATFEKDHPNATKHAAGFYYEVIKEGSGAKAKYGDLVNFDYKGYNMLTGELADDTKGKGGHPIQHVVGNPMFKGLIEGLQLMSPGAIYRFYFPSAIALGSEGSTNIPPNTPVIYEVELHKIVK